MTTILCSWLNNDLIISKFVDKNNFAAELSNGYLIGEVLNKYGLQDDFDQFSNNKSSDAKLRNFVKVEPVLKLLDIRFNTNIAHSIMNKDNVEITQLMYKLYIALNKRVRNNLTGLSIETRKASAISKINCKDKLGQVTKDHADEDLVSIIENCNQNQKTLEEKAFTMKYKDEQGNIRKLAEERQRLLDHHKKTQTKRSEILARIHCSSPKINLVPKCKIEKASGKLNDKLQKEILEARKDMEIFDNRMKSTIASSKKELSNDYLASLHKRVQENNAACAERSKLKSRYLIEQTKAIEAQVNAKNVENSKDICLRYSSDKNEQYVQWKEHRQDEKDLIQNRIYKNQLFKEQRQIEFELAMNREAEKLRIENIDQTDKREKKQKINAEIRAERMERKYGEHYAFCEDIVLGVIDISTKICEYRELTKRFVPDENQRLLDELFLKEYLENEEEWKPSEDFELKASLNRNTIFEDVA